MGGCCGGESGKAVFPGGDPFAHFASMIPNCLERAKAHKAAGGRVVGIMCEYTPREVIMAAGALPACLCGGSARMAELAEAELPVGLCPLIRSTYGYHMAGANPFLEMADLVVAETTCDGKKKMYELMGRTRPMHVLEMTQKSGDPAAFEHWLTEVRRLKQVLEARFCVEITGCALRRAIRTMNDERRLRRELAMTMRASPPPMTGRELLDLKSIISGQCADLAQYGRALDMIRAGRDAGTCGRVRVLLTGVPMAHGAERVMDIIESSGGVVVANESCTGLKPILEDIDADADDPLRAIAEKYYRLPCSVMTPNGRRMEIVEELARDYSAECVIELVWQGCLTYDVEAALVKAKAVETGLPYLKLDTDYSPSDNSRIATRVQALFETVKSGSKARKACCGGRKSGVDACGGCA